MAAANCVRCDGLKLSEFCFARRAGGTSESNYVTERDAGKKGLTGIFLRGAPDSITGSTDKMHKAGGVPAAAALN